MAAGLGFKTFTTGEVLTAADVNGYLMQGILVFANSTARSSAITSPQEGQYSFLKDTNALEYYDGAAWVGAPVGDITAVNAGTGITGGGASGSVTITNDMATTITAAGDIVVGTGNATYDNLPIGTTGQVLTADTTVSPYKVKWAAVGGSSAVGCYVKNSTSQSVTSGGYTTLTFDTEYFDTDAIHSTSSNTGRLTVPSGLGGKWLVSFNLITSSSSAVEFTAKIVLNNAADKNRCIWRTFGSSVNQSFCLSFPLTLADGDYIECRVYQASGSNQNITTDEYGGFGMVRIGA